MERVLIGNRGQRRREQARKESVPVVVGTTGVMTEKMEQQVPVSPSGRWSNFLHISSEDSKSFVRVPGGGRGGKRCQIGKGL